MSKKQTISSLELLSELNNAKQKVAYLIRERKDLEEAIKKIESNLFKVIELAFKDDSEERIKSLKNKFRVSEKKFQVDEEYLSSENNKTLLYSLDGKSSVCGLKGEKVLETGESDTISVTELMSALDTANQKIGELTSELENTKICSEQRKHRIDDLESQLSKAKKPQLRRVL
ncbi:hypothetical protein [Microbulbifer epialgicus]|uniref:Uncharacterized protein n=1 Tax=Microbulbifer epialgicus TaxID=393907 RepID=A0ABV4NTA2_9GAMM